MRACRTAEKAGIPAVAVVSTGFLRQAKVTARALGIEGTWIAEYPGIVPVDSLSVLEEKVRTAVVPSILEGLAGPAKSGQVAEAGPEPRAVVFRGTLDEVQEYF